MRATLGHWMSATGAYAWMISGVVIEAGTEVVSEEAEVAAVAEAVLMTTVVVMAAAEEEEGGPETVVGALEVVARDQTPEYVLSLCRTGS